MSQFEFSYIRNYLLPENMNDRNPIGNVQNSEGTVLSYLQNIGEKVMKTGNELGGCSVPDLMSAINLFSYVKYDLMLMFNYIVEPRNFRFCGSCSSNRGNCPFCNKEDVDVFASLACSHEACQECWESHILREMNRKKKPFLTCIGMNDGCKIFIRESFIKGFGEEFLSTLSLLQIQDFLNSSSTLRCCNRIYFNPLSNSNKSKLVSVTCVTCQNDKCFWCKGRCTHYPVPCDILDHFHEEVRKNFPYHEVCEKYTVMIDKCPYDECKGPDGKRTEVHKHPNTDYSYCKKCKVRWCFECGEKVINLSSNRHEFCTKDRKNKPTEELEKRREITSKLSSLFFRKPDFVHAFIDFSHFTGRATNAFEKFMSVDKRNLRRELYQIQFFSMKFMSYLTILKYYFENWRSISNLPRSLKKIFDTKGYNEKKFFDFDYNELKTTIFSNNRNKDQLIAKVLCMYRRIYEHILINKTFLPKPREFVRKEMIPQPHLPDCLESEVSSYRPIAHFIAKKSGNSLELYKNRVLKPQFHVDNQKRRGGNNHTSSNYQNDLALALSRSKMDFETIESVRMDEQMIQFQKMQQREEEERLAEVIRLSILEEEKKKRQEEKEVLEASQKIDMLIKEKEEEEEEKQGEEYYFEEDDEETGFTSFSDSEGDVDFDDDDDDVDDEPLENVYCGRTKKKEEEDEDEEDS